jgi:hypothetical protein
MPPAYLKAHEQVGTSNQRLLVATGHMPPSTVAPQTLRLVLTPGRLEPCLKPDGLNSVIYTFLCHHSSVSLS